MTTTMSPVQVKSLPFRAVEEFPAFDQIEEGDLFTLALKNNTTANTHGAHRFPGKFIPQVPRWAFDQFASCDSLVLDPFMGSGTTLVEGLLNGGLTIGLDIDPLARLIAKAKTVPISVDRLEMLGTHITQQWRGPSRHLAPPVPDVSNFGHWFSPENWGYLQSLLEILSGLNCSVEERIFLLMVFSSIVRWVSNADDQSHKTYVSGTLSKQPPHVVPTFWKHFRRALTGARNLHDNRSPKARVEIREDGDACKIPYGDRSLDLIITSPPYLDSTDYMYNFMLEYFWLGPLIGVPDRATFNSLRRRYIGTKQPLEAETLPINLRSTLDYSGMSLERTRAAASYFYSMRRHFVEASRCLKMGGRYVMVVGNSQTRSNILPVHECLARLAKESNLIVERTFGYRIRRHYMKFPRNGRGGIILIDWVIVLRKVETSPSTMRPMPMRWATLPVDAVAD